MVALDGLADGLLDELAQAFAALGEVAVEVVGAQGVGGYEVDGQQLVQSFVRDLGLAFDDLQVCLLYTSRCV